MDQGSCRVGASERRTSSVEPEGIKSMEHVCSHHYIIKALAAAIDYAIFPKIFEALSPDVNGISRAVIRHPGTLRS